MKKKFTELFGSGEFPATLSFAPGRVNLIGEHTDYNGGLVMPCAISFGTLLMLSKNNDQVMRFHSLNMPESAAVSLSEVAKKQPVEWVNYPLGVINQLISLGLQPTGVDMLFWGNIPAGAGLSSSASIGMATAVAFNHGFTLNIDIVDLVKVVQQAENEFVGVNCGIMDQFASGMGKKEHAILLDCNTLEYRHLPLQMKDYSIVIANTGKERDLAQSAYNQRVEECNKAVQYVSRIKPVRTLSELTYQEFIHLMHHIPDITIRKRAKHVVSENQRVLDAAAALQKGNLRLFGKLMNASHNSLKYDYEVTGSELDILADEARKVDGVLGARMTGAGFGGCTVNIVENRTVKKFIEIVGHNYNKASGLSAQFYICETSGGARLVQN